MCGDFLAKACATHTADATWHSKSNSKSNSRAKASGQAKQAKTSATATATANGAAIATAKITVQQTHVVCRIMVFPRRHRVRRHNCSQLANSPLLGAPANGVVLQRRSSPSRSAGRCGGRGQGSLVKHGRPSSDTICQASQPVRPACVAERREAHGAVQHHWLAGV